MTTSMLYPRNTRSRRVVDLSGLWDFRFDPEGTGQADGWTRGFKGGIQLPVPASFCDFFTDKESREYAGDFWYQTLVFVPEEWKGKSIAQLQVRQCYNINILAIKMAEELDPLPRADYQFSGQETLLLLGTNKDISRFLAG